MAMSYEWCVELVRVYDDGDNDIVDNAFQTSYSACVEYTKLPIESGYEYHIVLVCDYDDGRAWACVEDGELPTHFEDSMGNEVRKVPKKFILEIKNGYAT